MSTQLAAPDVALAPLDLIRQRTLRLLTQSSLLTSVSARRRSRVASLATIQVGVIFSLAVFFPVAMFFLGPLVFGVAHLAADARYLILRQRLPKPFVLLSAFSATFIVVIRSLEIAKIVHLATDFWEAGAGALWILSALAFAAHDRRSTRRAIALLVPITLIFAVASSHPRVANIAMMHVHNVIGVGAWVLLYPRKKLWELAPVIAVVLATAVTASGLPVSWAFRAGGAIAFDTHLQAIGRWLAPGFAPHAAAAITIAFVFLQAVHYAIWLTWVPQEDLKGEGTLTFRMTARSLIADFGVAGCALVLIAMLGLVWIALLKIQLALNWYLTLSRFHGLLELSVLAFFLVRGERLNSQARATHATRNAP